MARVTFIDLIDTVRGALDGKRSTRSIAQVFRRTASNTSTYTDGCSPRYIAVCEKRCAAKLAEC